MFKKKKKKKKNYQLVELTVSHKKYTTNGQSFKCNPYDESLKRREKKKAFKFSKPGVQMHMVFGVSCET